jgi:hypothetical protein
MDGERNARGQGAVTNAARATGKERARGREDWGYDWSDRGSSLGWSGAVCLARVKLQSRADEHSRVTARNFEQRRRNRRNRLAQTHKTRPCID